VYGNGAKETAAWENPPISMLGAVADPIAFVSHHQRRFTMVKVKRRHKTYKLKHKKLTLSPSNTTAIWSDKLKNIMQLTMMQYYN
jgi:hypothetical protein